jgi:ribonuclease HI/exonuclease III
MPWKPDNINIWCYNTAVGPIENRIGLAQQLRSSKVDICGLTETRCGAMDETLEGYTFLTSTTNGNRHGTGVALAKHIANCSETRHISDRITYVLTSVYQPGNRTENTLATVIGYAPAQQTTANLRKFWDQLHDTLAKVTKIATHTILMGDFNCHLSLNDMRAGGHPVRTKNNEEHLYPSTTDRQGIELLDLASSHNLEIQNLKSEKPLKRNITFPRAQTILDYILTTNSSLGTTTTMRTIEPRTKSDHKAVSIKLQVQPLPARRSHIDQPKQPERPKTTADILHEKVMEAAPPHQPQLPVTNPTNTCITTTTRAAIGKYHAYRKAFGTRSIPTRLAKREVRKNINRDRRRQMEKYAQQLESLHEDKQVHAAFKSLRILTKGKRQTGRHHRSTIAALHKHFRELYNRESTTPNIDQAFLPAQTHATQPPRPHVTVWGDGSHRPTTNTMAWAILRETETGLDEITIGRVEDSVAYENTPTRAETAAVLAALQTNKGKHIDYHTDALNCIRTYYKLPTHANAGFAHTTDGDLWKAIHYELQSTNMSMHKIKAHKGHRQHDICDHFAKSVAHNKAPNEYHTVTPTKFAPDWHTHSTPHPCPASFPTTSTQKLELHTNKAIPRTTINDETPDWEEIQQAARSISNTAAPGTDELHRNQILDDECFPHVVTLVQHMWEHHELPQAATQTTLQALKKRRNEPLTPDNARGIGWSSIITKIVATIILQRNADVPLTDVQFGFRHARNAPQAIAIVRDFVSLATGITTEAFAAFLDIEKAFDSVNRSILPQLLSAYGFGNNAIAIIEKMYNDEIFLKDKGHHTEAFTAANGVKQGCKLSPLIFAIYLDHAIRRCAGEMLPQDPHDVHAKLLAYADDIVLLALTAEDMQHNLDKIDEALRTIGLHLSPKKCVVLKIGTEEDTTRDTKLGYESRLRKLNIDNSTATPTTLNNSGSRAYVPANETVALKCPFTDCPYSANSGKNTPPRKLLLAHLRHIHNFTGRLSPHLFHTNINTDPTQDPRPTQTKKQSHTPRHGPTPTAFHIRGTWITETRQFKYLGSFISGDASLTAEITHRQQRAHATANALKKLLKSSRLTRRTRLTYLNVLVIPVLLYAAESWTPTKKDTSRLQKTYHQLIRKFTGIKFYFNKQTQTYEGTTPTIMRQITRLPSLTDKLREHRLRMLGQILREPTAIHSIALTRQYPQQHKGKRTRWVDQITQDLSQMQLPPIRHPDLSNLASNIPRWKHKIRAPQQNST